ncbi:MAG: phage tail tape measure protein [Bacteroides sp.]|nr:phage tail tape measure protein [Bacteroides sp.]
MAKKLTEDEIKWIVSVDSKEAQQEIHKLTNKNKELKEENKSNREAMQKLVAQGKKNTQEYNNHRKAIQENNAVMAKNRKTIEELTNKLNLNELSMSQLRKQARELKRQLDQTAQGTHPEQYAALDNQLKAVNLRMQQLTTSGQKMKASFSAATIAKGGLTTAAILFLNEIRKGVTTLKDFQKANSDLAAILQTTKSEIKDLTDDAKRLGAVTSFSASQVTQLQTELAKLGFNKQEIVDSTASILAFANAVEADLPEAFKLAGAALRAFGLEATEMERVVSVMGVSTTKSAMDFSFLKMAMATIAPVAKSFGFTIEDTVALLGTLADSGFDASSAATATRNILLNLTDSSGKLAKSLGGPVASFDELIPALAALNDHGVDLNTTLELTDKRSVAAFNTFLSGTEKATKLKESITDCGDALKAMQEVKLDNLAGDVAKMKSAWEGLLLKFEETADVQRSFIQGLTELIYKITEAIDWSKKYGAELKAIGTVLLTYLTTLKLLNLLKRQYTVLSGQAMAATKLENATLKIWNGLIAIKNTLVGILTGKIKLATAAQIAFNAVSPVGWMTTLISVLGGVISYLTIFRKKTQESTEAQQELAEAIDETKAAMDRMDDIRSKNKNRDQMNDRQLQDLRRRSAAELKEKEDALLEEEAILRDSIKRKQQILAEPLRDTTQQELEELYQKEMQYTEKVKQTKAELAELHAIVDSIPEKEIKVNIDLSGDDKSDMNAVRLKNLEATYIDEQNLIRRQAQEKQQTQEEINEALLKAEQDYYTKRLMLLEVFSKTEKKASKRSEYQKEAADLKTKLYNIELNLEKQQITRLEKIRMDALADEETINKSLLVTYTKQLAEKKITKEQHEMLLLTLTTQTNERRLAIEQQFQTDINGLEVKNGQLKVEAIKKANQQVLNAEQQLVNSRAAMQTKLDDLLKDFKNQFKLSTVEEDLQLQLKVLEATYQARKELARQNNLDTLELDAAYQRAKEKLVQESEERINQVRQQYGLLTQKEEYDQQLRQLQQHLDDKLLTEKEYEKAVQNLKRESFKKQFDYYLNLFSNAIQALQQAEMDNLDAQYDVQIEAAKGNAEEVERLENEKAQKKLDIQKKYADVNFAIRCSEIISSTAAAIMQAYAQLGPIAGAIAGALMGVTRAAQLASAVAERNKVKNMTLSGSSSSSTSTGKRVVTGKQSGGKIDVVREQDGKDFPDADYAPDARGFIDKPTVIVGEGPEGHSKEWVASNAAVENPTIAPFLNLLDKHQQAGDIATIDMNQILRQRMAAGFVSGGSISGKPVAGSATPSTAAPATPSTAENADIKTLNRLLSTLVSDGGVRAYVLLSELNKKQELMTKFRNIGSK